MKEIFILVQHYNDGIEQGKHNLSAHSTHELAEAQIPAAKQKIKDGIEEEVSNLEHFASEDGIPDSEIKSNVEFIRLQESCFSFTVEPVQLLN